LKTFLDGERVYEKK